MSLRKMWVFAIINTRDKKRWSNDKVMDDETAYFNFVLVKYDRFILQPDRLAEAFLYFCQGLGVSKCITYA